MRVCKGVLNIILVCVFMCFFSGCSSQEDSLKYSFNFGGYTYDGIYEGEMKNYLPNGKGIFQTTDDYEESFQVEGTWKDGKLNSKAKICYTDGSKMTVTFEDGVEEGNVIQYSEDGSYKKYKCINGIPNGSIKNYTKEGEIINYDWYYGGEAISELKQSSLEVEYSQMLYDPTSLYGMPIKITGVVSEIYDTGTQMIFILEDKDNHRYLFSYDNMSPVRYNQARTPNLMINDEIVAYGYLDTGFNQILTELGTSRLAIENVSDFEVAENIGFNQTILEQETDQTEGFEDTIPAFKLISSDLKNEVSFDRINANFEYEDINRYAYYYSGENYVLEGKVLNLSIDYNNNKVEMLVEENKSSGVFYCVDTLDKVEKMPVIGDDIELKGMLYGNYKVQYLEEDYVEDVANKKSYFIIYPRINIKSYM